MIWNVQVPPDPNAKIGEPAAEDLSCLSQKDRAKMSAWQSDFWPDIEEAAFWDLQDDRFWSKAYPKGRPKPPNNGGPPGNPGGGGAGGLGGNSESSITWQPGSPGPQCIPLTPASPVNLNGTGRCGMPCDEDWLCNWQQDGGVPPFFFDPKDPVCLRSFMPLLEEAKARYAMLT